MEQTIRIKTEMETLLRNLENEMLNDVIEHLSNNLELELNKIVCCR